ncbi:MAG: DUF167 domain-containing protein [Candidatus Thorarchaeota archaeon]
MKEGAIWESEKGTFLRVLVRPKSKEQNLIAQFSGSEIIVNLRSPAREGKANTELVKRFSKLLQLSTSSISLAAGQKSREKTLIVHNMSADMIIQKIQDSINDK